MQEEKLISALHIFRCNLGCLSGLMESYTTHQVSVRYMCIYECIYLHYCKLYAWLAPQVWRQRTFFLVCRKGFRFFEVQETELIFWGPWWCCKNTLTFDMFSKMNAVSVNSKFLPWQGMTLLDEKILKSWPQRTWHEESRPSLHKWLSPSSTEVQRKRLTCIGNIVMPDVCFLALQLLGHAERGGA